MEVPSTMKALELHKKFDATVVDMFYRHLLWRPEIGRKTTDFCTIYVILNDGRVGRVWLDPKPKRLPSGDFEIRIYKEEPKHGISFS